MRCLELRCNQLGKAQVPIHIDLTRTRDCCEYAPMYRYLSPSVFQHAQRIIRTTAKRLVCLGL